MTGIERLVDIVNDGPYSGGMIHISVQKLREICEQIEREVDDISRHESEVLAFVEEKGGLTELERRLMPEDYEWPRYESGELVEVGDEVVGPYYGERIRADEITFHANGFTLRENTGFEHWYESDDRFERPAVLASDGKPLEDGQTVYTLNDDRPYTVKKVETNRVSVNAGEGAYDVWRAPTYLTHQRPVLDADGVPIKVGDTVYGTVEGGPFIVTEVSDKGSVFVDAFLDTGMHGSMLTHTKPEPSDSWEKWREDFIKPPCVYCRDILGVDFDNDTELDKAFDAQAQDMERRARALAERDAS